MFSFEYIELKNCCDLLVSLHGRTIAVEIKDGNKPKAHVS